MKKHNNDERPAAIMHLPVHPSLKEVIRKAAFKEGLSMNDWVARVCADKLNVPELAAVPHKPFGRRKAV